MKTPTHTEWMNGAIVHVGDASIRYYASFYGRGHFQVYARGRGHIGNAKNITEARRIARAA